MPYAYESKQNAEGVKIASCDAKSMDETGSIEETKGAECEESDYKMLQQLEADDKSVINHLQKSGNNCPIYPVLGAFLSDVFHDPAYARKGYRLLTPGEAARYAPIAIWDNRIYVGTAERHMGIRPENESGFPHFVGEIQGKEIVNDSGHYRPPAGLGKMIPEDYKYKEKHRGDLESEIRLTMLSSPEDYVTKVQQIRGMKDDSARVAAILEFLKENTLYEKTEAAAYSYKNSHITNLFRDANIPIEKSVSETYWEIKGNITGVEQAAIFAPLTDTNRRRLNLLKTQLKNIDELTKNDKSLWQRPYSTIRDLVEPIPPQPANTPRVEIDQNQTEIQNQAKTEKSSPRRKSRLSTLFSCVSSRR